jgi:hypothetical protein
MSRARSRPLQAAGTRTAASPFVRGVPRCSPCLLSGGWDKNSSVGKHASSQLTQTVAVEGLADAFMAFNTNYHDTGLFGVYGVTARWVGGWE